MAAKVNWVEACKSWAFRQPSALGIYVQDTTVVHLGKSVPGCKVETHGIRLVIMPRDGTVLADVFIEQLWREGPNRMSRDAGKREVNYYLLEEFLTSMVCLGAV